MVVRKKQPVPRWKRPVKKRFAKHVNKRGRKVSHMSSRCWEWTGALNRSGYGQFAIAYKPHGAHRAAWIFANGDIPKGLHVLHKCDNPCCVRPDHLFLGSHSDNVQDAMNKGRITSGEDHHAVKLSDKEVRDIRKSYAQGCSTQVTLAKEYGIHKVYISSLVRFKSRKTA